MAGYDMSAAWMLEGDTFRMNITFITGVEGKAEGLAALGDSFMGMAKEAGATDLSIKASWVTEERLADPEIMSRVASMNGWTYTFIDSSTFLLTRSIP